MKRVLRLPRAALRRNGEIEMQKALLASIVASSSEAISSFTLDGIATSWNSAAERLFGYSADEIIGQTLEILVPSEMVGQLAGIRKKIGKGLSFVNFETVRL